MSKRKLLPDLEAIIESKIKEIAPEVYAKALAQGDALTITALAGDALTALKVRERTNKNDGVMVEMIQKTSGGSRGDAWCMWQQMTQIAFAEKKTGKVSLVPSSGSCAFVRTKSPQSIVVRLQDSLPGDLWILVRSNGLGHVGNFRGWKKYPTEAILNEGNTTEGKVGGEIMREGGGSYRTERLTSMWKMAVRPFAPVSVLEEPKHVPASEPHQYPQFNERSDRVATMQRALARHGFSPGKIDGWFYNGTKAALSKFQKSHGLTGTGIPAGKTMALLEGAESAPEFVGDARNPNWSALWETCQIDPDRVSEVKKVVGRIVKNISVYEEIGKRANCAWWVPALLHYRESSSLPLDVYLHNGQKLGKTTTIVPKGVFFRKDQFVDAAVDALDRDGLTGIQDPVAFLPFSERFNGLGYRKKIGDHGRIEYSPYVFAGTNHHDETGKYVRDGVYDPKAKESQLGVAAILKGLIA